jgi:propanediol utilization protein
VEISAGDAYVLGINAPIKISGDLKDAGYVKIV